MLAQTPADALMMEKGQICFAALYSNETWDEYWEGTLKRSNGNIGTYTRQSIMPMFALGITDRINVMAALPWVKTEASQGQMRGVSGFQDLGLWIKARAFETPAGPGLVSLHGTLGLTLPTSDYLEDYAPFSLGLGCPDFSLRGILQYRLDMGLYVRGQAAYMIRGNAKIERDYYYTTHGVYSDEVDMPNALGYGATLGIWTLGNTLNVEATFDGLNTYGGFDIRRQDAGFPSNKMNFTRVGGGIHYFFPFVPGMGVIVQGSKILTGRNVGQSTVITAGLTYQFGLWGSSEDIITTD
jgi:hypothetical protein